MWTKAGEHWQVPLDRVELAMVSEVFYFSSTHPVFPHHYIHPANDIHQVRELFEAQVEAARAAIEVPLVVILLLVSPSHPGFEVERRRVLTLSEGRARARVEDKIAR